MSDARRGAAGDSTITVVGIRRLIRLRKIADGRGELRWRTDVIPAAAFIFPKPRACPPNGAWRSLRAKSGGEEFTLLVLTQPQQAEMKAWLALRAPAGWVMIARLEQHGDHPGLHVHEGCGQEGLPLGPASINAIKGRRPKARSFHRHETLLDREQFFAEALRRFRIKADALMRQGDLGV